MIEPGKESFEEIGEVGRQDSLSIPNDLGLESRSSDLRSKLKDLLTKPSFEFENLADIVGNDTLRSDKVFLQELSLSLGIDRNEGLQFLDVLREKGTKDGFRFLGNLFNWQKESKEFADFISRRNEDAIYLVVRSMEKVILENPLIKKEELLTQFLDYKISGVSLTPRQRKYIESAINIYFSEKKDVRDYLIISFEKLGLSYLLRDELFIPNSLNSIIKSNLKLKRKILLDLGLNDNDLTDDVLEMTDIKFEDSVTIMIYAGVPEVFDSISGGSLFSESSGMYLVSNKEFRLVDGEFLKDKVGLVNKQSSGNFQAVADHEQQHAWFYRFFPSFLIKNIDERCGLDEFAAYLKDGSFTNFSFTDVFSCLSEKDSLAENSTFIKYYEILSYLIRLEEIGFDPKELSSVFSTASSFRDVIERLKIEDRFRLGSFTQFDLDSLPDFISPHKIFAYLRLAKENGLDNELLVERLNDDFSDVFYSEMSSLKMERYRALYKTYVGEELSYKKIFRVLVLNVFEGFFENKSNLLDDLIDVSDNLKRINLKLSFIKEVKNFSLKDIIGEDYFLQLKKDFLVQCEKGLRQDCFEIREFSNSSFKIFKFRFLDSLDIIDEIFPGSSGDIFSLTDVLIAQIKELLALKKLGSGERNIILEEILKYSSNYKKFFELALFGKFKELEKEVKDDIPENLVDGLDFLEASKVGNMVYLYFGDKSKYENDEFTDNNFSYPPGYKSDISIEFKNGGFEVVEKFRNLEKRRLRKVGDNPSFLRSDFLENRFNKNLFRREFDAGDVRVEVNLKKRLISVEDYVGGGTSTFHF